MAAGKERPNSSTEVCHAIYSSTAPSPHRKQVTARQSWRLSVLLSAPLYLSAILLLSECQWALETDISAHCLLSHSHLSHLLGLAHALNDSLGHALRLLLRLRGPTAPPWGLCLVSSYQPQTMGSLQVQPRYWRISISAY